MMRLFRNKKTLILCALCLAGNAPADPGRETPTLDELQAAGATIGEVIIQVNDVFDTSSPAENKSIFRLANRLHVNTRDSVIKSQLLFRSGDPLIRSVIEESARILRRNQFFYDAAIRVVRYENNVVDLVISARDNWTLLPEISLSRSGGETRYQFGIEEDNLLGTGSAVAISRRKDEDRRSTAFQFSDRNVGRSWVGVNLGYRDSDDGAGSRISVVRPFYALDTTWSAGIDVNDDDREDPLFSRGDEVARFRHDEQSATVWFGWSRGLVDNWTSRWSVGWQLSDNRFALPDDPADALVVPVDRDLRYPFLRYERIENRFAVAQNLNQIVRTEDIYLGTRYGITVGLLGSDLAADRSGGVVQADFQTTMGDPADRFLTVNAGVDGRIESGDAVNTRLAVAASYYRRQSAQRVFFARLSGVAGRDLDIDQLLELGGDTGLRGYPRAFGSGESRAVLTLEQRIYTNWYPFRLFRVGAAAFFDAGRIWGEDATGRSDDRLLSNVGIGLRLGSTRGNSNRVIHIDLAFPLRRDPRVDDVQILLESKRSF